MRPRRSVRDITRHRWGVTTTPARDRSGTHGVRMKTTLLVAYVTRYGQTQKIAQRIAAVASEAGIAAKARPIEKVDTLPAPDYDLLIIAGAVYFGRHDRRLEAWVRKNLAAISTLDAAFVSVSGSKDEKFVHDFARRTGWVPECSISVAGGEPYPKYGFFTRLVMRSIARRLGRQVDVHQNYEFTDWEAVDRFARDFVGYALYRNNNTAESAQISSATASAAPPKRPNTSVPPVATRTAAPTSAKRVDA